MILKVIGGIAAAIGTILLVAFLSMGGDYIGLQWYKFIAPQQENARREVFEQTKSFNQGMTMKLLDYRKQYMFAKSPGDKAAIASVVSHLYADYSPDNLDPELREFLKDCKYNQ